MVVNTNDPDYEHIYSIESYNDNADELLYVAPPGSNSDGAAFLLVSRATLHFLRCLSNRSIPAVLFMLIVCFSFVCALAGGTVEEPDKTDAFELNTSPNISAAEPTIDGGQKTVKVSPKATRSVRFKRRASGKGKSAYRPGGWCSIMWLKKAGTTK